MLSQSDTQRWVVGHLCDTTTERQSTKQWQSTALQLALCWRQGRSKTTRTRNRIIRFPGQAWIDREKMNPTVDSTHSVFYFTPPPKWPILCRNDLYCVGWGVLTVLFQGRFQKNHKIEINSVTLFQFVWNNSKKFHMGKNIAINSIVCFRRWKVCDWNIKLIDWDLTALSVQICYSVLQQICCS